MNIYNEIKFLISFFYKLKMCKILHEYILYPSHQFKKKIDMFTLKKIKQEIINNAMGWILYWRI